jgi:hypothetical protein
MTCHHPSRRHPGDIGVGWWLRHFTSIHNDGSKPRDTADRLVIDQIRIYEHVYRERNRLRRQPREAA